MHGVSGLGQQGHLEKRNDKSHYQEEMFRKTCVYKANLKFSLHLSDGERLVQSVYARQEEQLGGGDGEELLAQPGKPSRPVAFGGSEVDSPLEATLWRF